jgi:hypothetical protein
MVANTKKIACFMVILVFLFYLYLGTNKLSCAKSEDYILEVEQHWETYGIGGTCIPGGHNLAVADVDGDNVLEMITGGFSYFLANGSRTTSQAPLKIWSWDGQNLTLEKSESWDGGIWCVYAADVDADGKTEILTWGNVAGRNGSCLRIWTWDGSALLLEGDYKGISAASISVCDVDLDSMPEIITVGTPANASQSTGQLCVWQWDGSSLKLESSVEWTGSEGARANSVCTCDLDNDGSFEIITGGYNNHLENSAGQLRVWHFNETELSLVANEEWQLLGDAYALTTVGGVQGNTMVNNVKAADVDKDGVPEIVTGGFTYDGNNVEAQLRIWNWNGTTIILEKSEEWVTDYITEVKCISISDIDDDSRVEIVSSGVTAPKMDVVAPEQAQLRAWSWDGSSLSLKQNIDWVVGDGVCAWIVAAGDVDRDGITEVVTVGCMYVDVQCDPDLRIWSTGTAQVPFLFIAGAIAGIALVMVSAVFLIRKRQKRSEKHNMVESN